MKRKKKSKTNLIKLKNGTRIYLANLSHYKDSENKFYFTLPLLNPKSWNLTKEDIAFVKEAKEGFLKTYTMEEKVAKALDDFYLKYGKKPFFIFMKWEDRMELVKEQANFLPEKDIEKLNYPFLKFGNVDVLTERDVLNI